MSKDKPSRDQKKVAGVNKMKILSSYKMEGQSKSVEMPILKGRKVVL